MILIISTCKEKLHEKEFVEPVETILKNLGNSYLIRHYTALKKEDLQKFEKIIITGTSLQDNEYLQYPEIFNPLKKVHKPILGICAGMQILTLLEQKELLTSANIKKLQTKKLEIGYYKEKFKKEFLGLQGTQEVYHLHQNTFEIPKTYQTYTTSKTAQAIKHKKKPWYATLFHPEVRNKELIERFIHLN